MIDFYKKPSTQKVLFILSAGIFLLTPLLSAMVFCLKDGRMLNEVCIYLSGWSDEITYFKQIEGMVEYGSPKGYFGYNQSKAMYGPYSVWGIFPLIPYYLFGLIFGWTYQSPIYANIFLCTIALLIFIIMVRPRWSKMLGFSACWLFYYFLNRYVVSGVIEAFFISTLIIIYSCGMYLHSSMVREQPGRCFTSRKNTIVLVGVTILIMYITICRPYYAVLFLIPFWKTIREKSIPGCIALPVSALLSIIIFFINNKYFCSTYFNNMLDFSGGGISKIADSLYRIWDSILASIQYDYDMGWYYIVFFFGMGLMLLHCIYRLLRRKSVSFLFVSTLIGNTLILLSILLIYELSVSARHILSLNVAMIFIILMEFHELWCAAFVYISIRCWMFIGNINPTSYINADYEPYFQSLRSTFAEHVTVSDELSYDNLVAMPTSDRHQENTNQTVATYYGLMYAMPAGVGISLDFEDYYENPDNLKAGYILCHPQGQIRLILEENDMTCVFENEEFVLYKR